MCRLRKHKPFRKSWMGAWSWTNLSSTPLQISCATSEEVGAASEPTDHAAVREANTVRGSFMQPLPQAPGQSYHQHTRPCWNLRSPLETVSRRTGCREELLGHLEEHCLTAARHRNNFPHSSLFLGAEASLLAELGCHTASCDSWSLDLLTGEVLSRPVLLNSSVHSTSCPTRG